MALLQTVLESSGQEVLVARGWRIARDASVPLIGKNGGVPAIPAAAKAPRFPGTDAGGYLAEIEWRFEAGNFDEPGPCQVCARPRITLLPGEDISPMSRALLLADSGNGISMALDPRAYLFINVDLTVVLQRDPVGEWLLMDAVTTMGGTGTGLAETRLSDTSGEVGIGVQSLLVSPR